MNRRLRCGIVLVLVMAIASPVGVDTALGQTIQANPDNSRLAPFSSGSDIGGHDGGGASEPPVSQPAAYDLRSFGYVSPVKAQGSCGSCWAFATMAALESSILVDTLGTTTRDFSENNLKNYHGFDLGPCAGGQILMSQAYFSRGSGPVNESDDQYFPGDDRQTPPPNVPVQSYVRQSLYFDTTNEIKTELMARGALHTSMYMDQTYYRSADATYYYNGGTGTNHAVAIVGWDNSKVTAATNPGAWLIKNSWGAGWGAGGYFWISYDDTAGGKYGASFEDAVPADTFSTIYYHDEFGQVSSLSNPCAFNAFTPTSSEDLEAVQFWTQADGASYDVKIYDTYSGGALSNLLASTTGTLQYEGYHTIDLPSAVSLTASDPFYVYLELTNGGDYPQAYDYAYTATWGPYSTSSTASAGESYYSFNGMNWTDLTTHDSTANFAIKALTGGYTPAYIWADAASAWSNLNTWRLNGQVPGSLPGPSDQVELPADASISNQPTVDDPFSIAGLSIDNSQASYNIGVADDGSLTLGNDGLTMIGGSTTIAPDVTLGADQTWDTGAGTLIVNGDVDGSGNMTKDGSGYLVMNGNNTNTGTTTVAEGTLKGTGTMCADVIIDQDAFLAPGASIGDFVINGDLDLDGTLKVEMDGSIPDNDFLVVNGTLTLDVGTSVLDLDIASALDANTDFLLIDYDTLVGTFGTINNLPSTTHTLSYGAGSDDSIWLLHTQGVIPEPSTLLLLVIALSALLVRRRRR